MERAEDVVVLLEGREDHDPRLRRRDEHLARGGDAVEVGHPHIHQHDVGRPGADGRDGGPAVRRLAHHLDARITLQDRSQPRPHEVVVVDEHDADRRICHGCSAPA
jgi:hypothetical protein